jgi:hypothetical protein
MCIICGFQNEVIAVTQWPSADRLALANAELWPIAIQQRRIFGKHVYYSVYCFGPCSFPGTSKAATSHAQACPVALLWDTLARCATDISETRITDQRNVNNMKRIC